MPVLSDKSTIAEIRAYFLRSQGFDLRLSQLLQKAPFHELDNIPVEIQKTWTESTTSPPLRLSAQRCWRSRAPSFQELWLATSRIPKKGMSTTPLSYIQAKKMRYQGFRTRPSRWRSSCCILPARRTRFLEPDVYYWCTASVIGQRESFSTSRGIF
jgi:hypothetical protein